MYGIIRKDKIMSRKFELWNDPYGRGFDLWGKRIIEINNGVTVLVGCNGIGKTSMLKNIESILKDNNIPVIQFNNFLDGGVNAQSEKIFTGDFNFLSESVCSSEGENIILNLCDLATKLGVFVNKDINKKDKMQEKTSNERWILFDAVDSGLSIDNIIDVKEKLLKIIIEHKKDKDIYIIISANEYEMANSEQCFDVYNGKYITFKNYDEYKNMILESRKWKEKRGK